MLCATFHGFTHYKVQLCAMLCSTYYSTPSVQGVLPKPAVPRPPFVIESNAPISVGFAHLGEADFVGKPASQPAYPASCQ
jgi:hypothetical protein